MNEWSTEVFVEQPLVFPGSANHRTCRVVNIILVSTSLCVYKWLHKLFCHKFTLKYTVVLKDMDVISNNWTKQLIQHLPLNTRHLPLKSTNKLQCLTFDCWRSVETGASNFTHQMISFCKRLQILQLLLLHNLNYFFYSSNLFYN